MSISAKKIEIEYKFFIPKEQLESLKIQLQKECRESCYFEKLDNYYRCTNNKTIDTLVQPLDIRLRNIVLYNIDAHFLKSNIHTNTSMLTFKIKQNSTNIKKTIDDIPNADGQINSIKNDDSKRKIYQIGAEINDEYETEIENPQIIEQLLMYMGAKHHIYKEKKGWKYELSIPEDILFLIQENVELDIIQEDNSYWEKLPRSIIIELVEVAPLGYFLEIEVLILACLYNIAILTILDDYLQQTIAALQIDIHTFEPCSYMEMIQAAKNK